jgi:hypothetical protein
MREEWLDFFQVELPKVQDPLVAKVVEIWAQYMSEIRSHIRDTAPKIISYFDAIENVFGSIEDELTNKVSSSIRSLSEGSSRIHPLFIESLKNGLIPMFHEALKMTGKLLCPLSSPHHSPHPISYP